MHRARTIVNIGKSKEGLFLQFLLSVGLNWSWYFPSLPLLPRTMAFPAPGGGKITRRSRSISLASRARRLFLRSSRSPASSFDRRDLPPSLLLASPSSWLAPASREGGDRRWRRRRPRRSSECLDRFPRDVVVALPRRSSGGRLLRSGSADLRDDSRSSSASPPPSSSSSRRRRAHRVTPSPSPANPTTSSASPEGGQDLTNKDMGSILPFHPSSLLAN